MKDVGVEQLIEKQPAPEQDVAPFKNNLVKQEKSFLSKTYTVDTNKQERRREFSMEDAIRGFFPRSRSSGPRRSFKEVHAMARPPCHSTPVISNCKLPSLDSCPPPNRSCTMRPWSRTQEELRKFKQTLNGKKFNSDNKCPTIPRDKS